MHAILLIITVLLVSVPVWAEQPTKSQSLTIEKDSRTNTWMAICDASLPGLDATQIYSGVMLFDFAPTVGRTVNVFEAVWLVRRAQSVGEFVPGVYDFKARMDGQQIILHAEVNLARFNFTTNDTVFCSTRFDRGAEPGPVERGLFGADSTAVLRTSP